jgi:hypothetical protein
MIFKTIPLLQINFSDESCRLSDDLHSERMEASIQEIGQVTPVVVVAMPDGKYAIVCGFRRLHAMRRLGLAEASARVEDGARTRLELFLTALYDNLSHRALTCFEQARVICRLGECGVPDEVLISKFMPALGLKPHRESLNGSRRLLKLVPDLRDLVLHDRLTETSAQRLAAYPEDIQSRFVRLLQPIRLSASLQRKVLDLIDDLGATASSGISAVLDHRALGAILEDEKLSPPQKGEQIHGYLARERYPRLSRAHEDFRATKADLALPGTVTVVPDPYFETPRVRFGFEASGPDQFRSIIAALEAAGRRPQLQDLFRLKENR